MFFADNRNCLQFLVGLMCSKIANCFLQTLNPTLTFQVVDIGNLPVIISENSKKPVEKVVKASIEYAKTDWDSVETSWDFKRHPML